MMNYDFDITVIGGGAGGLFASSVANTLGARTCMIEKTRLGGDCTWFGCMPSKALLKSAQIANLFKEHSRFGLKMSESLSIDANNVMTRVKEVVDEIATHHPTEVFEKRGIKVIYGAPQFVNEYTVKVNGKNITSKKFIICTGSHPLIPHIEGLKDVDYLTNENIFDLKNLPESLIVLGGGPIGLELSQALNRLGVKISVVEMLDRILFREDKEIASVLDERLRKEGINIFTGKKAIKFEKKDNRVYVTIEDKSGKKEKIDALNVLVAVGRAPNVEGLSLEKADVLYTKKGINVNSYLQTSNKNIFACGDVIGPYMFSHVAAYQAGICVRNALFRKIAWQKASYQNIAWATFTEPEVSHLGLTEEEAREANKDIKVYKTEYSNSDRAITDLKKEGFIKVVTNKKGYILGAHIVGAEASEIIQGLLVAKSLKAPLSKIAPILFIYPTLSELVRKTAAKPLLEKMDNPIVKFAMKIMRKND